ncbi:MAG TPA: hypothetical protein VG328_20545 [Stellaceae bacterium]|nr:hypothetical protein [Stellaceae bacterium]
MNPRANSVDQLAKLYNVVIGVALALSINTLIDVHAAYFPVKPDLLPLFCAFLVTVIPFHHGASRHLYATYVEDGGSTRIKSGALALDFLILFVEGCLFVALAAVIGNPSAFSTVMLALLLVDCAWGFLSHLAFTGAQAQNAERKWSVINLVAAAVLILTILILPRIFAGWTTEVQECVAMICILRSICDYAKTWKFYFPDA